MSFTLTKPGGWAFGELLTSGQIEDIDGKTANAVDGVGGGSYAPSTQLTFGGKGLAVTGPFACSGAATFTSAVTLGNAESDTITVNGLLVINNDVVFDNDVQLGSGGADAINVDGVATFSNEATFEDGIDVTGGGATIVGNTEVTGTFETSGDVTVGDDLSVTDAATIHGNLYCGGTTFTAENNVVLGTSSSDDITINGRIQNRLLFEGAGRVTLRLYALGNADETVSITDGNSFRVPTGNTAARTYTLSTSGATDGDDMEFWMDKQTMGLTHEVRFGYGPANWIWSTSMPAYPYVRFVFHDGDWHPVPGRS